MSKQSALKSLESIIGKLSSLNGQIQGNQLQTAIREVANVRDRVENGQLKVK